MKALMFKDNYDWRYRNGGNNPQLDVGAAVERQLARDGDRGSGGVAENAYAQAEACQKFLAQLVEKLHARGSLSDDDVCDLLPSFNKVA